MTITHLALLSSCKNEYTKWNGMEGKIKKSMNHQIINIFFDGKMLPSSITTKIELETYKNVSPKLIER